MPNPNSSWSQTDCRAPRERANRWRLRKAVGDREWSVTTNMRALGTNVTVVIRETDLAVIRGGYLRR